MLFKYWYGNAKLNSIR